MGKGRRLMNPIGVVVGFAVFAAGYSSLRHFVVDKNLRLARQNRAADGHGEGHAEDHAEGEKH